MTRERTVRRPERPRDRFGRPLPWGSSSEIELEDYASLTILANHALAIAHFNAGRFFQAHEAWEESWRKAEGSADEAFFKGLAQLGAAYTHYARGNAHGARVLLERALERIEPSAPSYLDIDISRVVPRFREHVDALGDAEREEAALPDIQPPEL